VRKTTIKKERLKEKERGLDALGEGRKGGGRKGSRKRGGRSRAHRQGEGGKRKKKAWLFFGGKKKE